MKKEKVDLDFSESLVLTNMCKPDKKPKTFVEARCIPNGHIMVLAQLDRYWACNGECRRGRNDYPNTDYYTCV